MTTQFTSPWSSLKTAVMNRLNDEFGILISSAESRRFDGVLSTPMFDMLAEMSSILDEITKAQKLEI